MSRKLKMANLPLPPFYAELARKIEELDSFITDLCRSQKACDAEGLPNLELDHLAHAKGLTLLLTLVLEDFREDAKEMQATAEMMKGAFI